MYNFYFSFLLSWLEALVQWWIDDSRCIHAQFLFLREKIIHFTIKYDAFVGGQIPIDGLCSFPFKNVQQTALEDRETTFLRNKGQVYFLSSISVSLHDISLVGLSEAHCKIFRFPELGVSLVMQPTVCAGVTWPSLGCPAGTEAQGTR